MPNVIPPGKRPGRRFSKARFVAFAEPIRISIDGRHFADAPPKKMKTGKLGYFAPGRIHLKIGGITVEAQVNVNITIIKSDRFPEVAPESDSDIPSTMTDTATTAAVATVLDNDCEKP